MAFRHRNLFHTFYRHLPASFTVPSLHPSVFALAASEPWPRLHSLYPARDVFLELPSCGHPLSYQEGAPPVRLLLSFSSQIHPYQRGVSSASCERIVYRHGAILLIVRDCSGFNPRRWRHCESCAGQRTGRQWKRKVEVRDKEKGDKTRTNNARSNMWHHGWQVDGTNAHLRHLEPQCGRKHMCKVHEKKHVWGVPVNNPVGYSGSLPTLNETNFHKKKSHQKKKNYELISNSIQTCPTTMCLKRDAIVCVDLDG